MKFKYKTKPYKHQENALEKSYNKKNYAYFMEMGCGKSKVLLDNIAWLYIQKEIDTAIIVAPKGVYRNWEVSEIPTHFLDEIDKDVYIWNSSPNKSQEKELVRGTQDRTKLRILLINVEGFATPKVKKYIHAFTQNCKFMLAVDESTTIKNLKAKRTKALIAFGQKASYKRILTGSPVTKSPLDLFSQCSFMSNQLLGFASYFAFQGRYAVTRTQQMGAHSFQQIIGYRNLEELSNKLNNFSFRVTKDQALDLPDKIYTTREVSLSTEQLQHYTSLKKNAVTMIDDELISATEVMTQLLRLQQVLCGYLKTDDGNIIDIKNNRMDALFETIEEMDGKVIIWSRFRKDIISIAAKLSKKYGQGAVVNFFGDTSDSDRKDAVKNFQFGDARFFVANPQTAGFGLTLTAATNVIYYANDFNLETRVQSEDRCHRIGQNKSVTYVDLLCRGTIDEYIVKSLKAKINLASASLNEEVRKWLDLSPKKV
jgi:SNF2 family DNA or RNA helicase